MKATFQKTPEQIPFTKEGYDNVLAQKAKLLAERPAAVEHLRLAREMGDLSENGYYKASRQRLSFLDARIRHFDRLVKHGVIVASQKNGLVDIGTTVTLSDGTVHLTYTVVGGFESDPKNKTISHKSPIGRALMGRKVGESIIVHAPKGDISYIIEKAT